jgi:UDP-3-O-[3-hydroxymyristoyl] N-acetylglucosamine deacetylase
LASIIPGRWFYRCPADDLPTPSEDGLLNLEKRFSTFVTDDWRIWMYPTRYQRTIATPARMEGVGYWGGEDVHVEFRPAAEDTGIVFVRSDLPGCPRIPAAIEHRIETPRRTSLCSGPAGVEMIEHIMAALAGLQIDNCEVWVDRSEMPGCDGSCLPFVEPLQLSGVVEQGTLRRRHVIGRTIRLGNRESWIEARPCRSSKTILQYELDFGSGSPIGQQSLEVSLSPRHFHMNLAPSRTFMLEAEAEAMRARGLGLRATCKDLLVFGSRGPIDNQLRFPDECVRHKLADMVGDLALTGCDLVGRISAFRSGHRLNAELVRAIVAESQIHDQLRRCA